MKLAARLTVYYVSALAAVLAGFSIALYALAAEHLRGQADERLETALNILAAAAEIEPDGVAWEPEERSLAFGGLAPEGRFSWRISDGRGGRVDGSAAGEIDRALARLDDGDQGRRAFASFTDASGASWRMLCRRLQAPRRDGDAAGVVPARPGHHDALVVAAATSLEGVRSNLRNLGLALAALSAAVWSISLVTGRKLCGLALRPVAEMAAAARAIGGDDPAGRLPAPRTDDELAELGRSFNSLLDRLGDSMQRQRRFAGDASHQIRTPLTALQGHVDLALRHDRSPEEYRRALALVQSKARHLRQIIDGLMFLSRADAESRRPSLEVLPLDEWLPGRLDAWAGPRRPDLSYGSDVAGPCLVLVHPPLLGELLDNLLDNAAKYSPPGTPVTIRLSRRAGDVSFRVSDLGPGIGPADLPHVFDPFFRAEAARLRGSPGVGLGLSVAARIAGVFGGRITVDGAPGRGAAFTVVLPEYRPDEEGGPSSPPA